MLNFPQSTAILAAGMHVMGMVRE